MKSLADKPPAFKKTGFRLRRPIGRAGRGQVDGRHPRFFGAQLVEEIRCRLAGGEDFYNFCLPENRREKIAFRIFDAGVRCAINIAGMQDIP